MPPPPAPDARLGVRRLPRPWWWWTAWAVAVIVLGALAARAKHTSDLTRTLPSSDPQLNRILTFFLPRHDQGGSANDASRLLAIEGTSDAQASPDAVTETLQHVATTLAPYGAHPVPDPGPTAIATMADVVEAHLPELVDADELHLLAERIRPAALVPYLQALRERASRPDDTLVGSASRGDVLAVGGEELRALIPQNGIGFTKGVVSHPDGHHFLLPLTIDFDPGDTAKTFALMQAVWQEVDAARSHGVVLDPIGSYRNFDDNMHTLFGDFIATIPVGVGAILFVLWTLSRSWAGVGAMYLPAALGLIAAVAMVSTTSGEVPTPLIGFAASLLGVAVDYGIQMTIALHRGEADHVRSPLLRSYIVSMCAFGMLAGSTVPALADLALMVLAGLTLAYLSARWLLPSIITPRLLPDPWGRVTAPVLRWCEARRWWLFGAALVITLALLPFLRQVHFLDDIQEMDGSTKATKASLAAFLQRWGSLESSNFLVVTAPTTDGALRQLAHARDLLHLPPSLLERALPDQATQERHRAAWNAFWTAHATFRADFAAACAQVHLRAAAFQASMDRYQPQPPAPVHLQDWEGTPLETMFSKLVVHVADGMRVAIPVDLPGPAMAQLERHVKQAHIPLDPVWIASRTILATRLVEVLQADLERRGIYILLAVLIAVAVLVRRPRLIAAMILPPAVALLWTFSLLGLAGERLTPFSVLVAAFVGGIGIDCAVFLASREHRARLVTPVIGCIATAVAGTAVMLYARHPLLCGVGVMLTTGMCACLVASLMLTPALAGTASSPRP